jgi:hypothetical protein
MAGMRTLLIGDQVARYFVQDAIRGVDYHAAALDPRIVGLEVQLSPAPRPPRGPHS